MEQDSHTTSQDSQNKMENLNKKNKSKSIFCLKKFKLCDFGLSFHSVESRPPSIGDGNYLAPELFKSKKNHLKVKVILF